jgi:hypothetical protein
LGDGGGGGEGVVGVVTDTDGTGGTGGGGGRGAVGTVTVGRVTVGIGGSCARLLPAQPPSRPAARKMGSRTGTERFCI